MFEFTQVTKRYGKTIGLDEFSLAVSEPGIYCLLGKNGAGKTTMMRLLAGHIAATSGTVAADGQLVGRLSMPHSVYYVESTASQFNVRLDELLAYAAKVNPGFDAEFARMMAQRFELDFRRRFRQLSFGMKTMVNTLLALASGKDTLLLDEPVLGFDPVKRRTFYELLSECCAERPKTVLVSTHIIDEIERASEQLLIIDHGQLKLYCSMAEIDEKAYCVVGPASQVVSATDGLNIIGETTAGGFLSRSVFDRRVPQGDGYAITKLGLQDFFIGLVGDKREEF
ncbi:MAG: ABC transporter ATP-binding protein [Coriobacteriales bacterium]|jgi:ABC-2 type transport system ATP-binding protein|nr:ABC transporter ATP-binding protein [Coriobacteriales bacterium]